MSKINYRDTIELGAAWSGNSVNMAIYRKGLTSRHGYQYGTYYDSDMQAVVFQRELASGNIKQHIFDTMEALDDAHLISSIGVDAKGYIHLSYYHHNAPLKYRRSLKPHNIEGFSDLQEMTGKLEDRVCYPYFLHSNDDKDSAFYFIYRHGKSGNGALYIKKYNAESQSWGDSKLPVLSGMDMQPWTSNPYIQTPILDKNGTIHLFTTWRTHSVGENKLVNNVNLDYLRSHDDGKTWEGASGSPLSLPITQVNSETAIAVPPASNFMNQAGAAVDNIQRPMVVYYHNDDKKIPQYYISRFDSGKWQTAKIGDRKHAFSLQGAGTLRVPISRPEVLVNKKNQPIVIYRADISGNRMVANILDTKTLKTLKVVELTEENIGMSEPVVDRDRWKKDNVLSLLIQHSDQPDNEGKPKKKSSPISIREYNI